MFGPEQILKIPYGADCQITEDEVAFYVFIHEYPYRPCLKIRLEYPETLLNIPLGCVHAHYLIGRKILIVGNDGVISVPLFLFRNLRFVNSGHMAFTVHGEIPARTIPEGLGSGSVGNSLLSLGDSPYPVSGILCSPYECIETI